MLFANIPVFLSANIIYAYVDLPPHNHLIILEWNVLMTSGEEITHLGEIAMELSDHSFVTRSSLMSQLVFKIF